MAKSRLNEEKIYTMFCAPRFKALEGKVGELYTTVNDGLKQDVKELKEDAGELRKHSRWMIGLLVVILLAVLGTVTTLWMEERHQYKDLDARIERQIQDARIGG